MKDISERFDDFIQYAEVTKKYQDLDFYKQAKAEIDRLRAENEQLRMQLAACGVVALANTPESAAQQRAMHPDYMSESCRDVMRAVDREMALRARLGEIEGQEPVAFCEDAALSIAERTFSTEVDERLASDFIQYAQRLHSLYTAPQPAEQPVFTVGTDLSDGELSVVVMKHENDITWVIHSEIIQLTEQQPDVTQLVEALELAQGFLRNKGYPEEDPLLLGVINAALAAHRKQRGGE